MILFPPCKINLGLRVLGKRKDGYHDLQTVFYPVGIRDALEIIPSTAVSLHVTGKSIPGDSAQNLCLKAYELLARDFPAVGPVEIHLHKQIPMGAGLGGGSSDGAYAIRLLDKIFLGHLTTDQKVSYALELGSDCPFFVFDGPCKASGRGEMLEPVELDLSAFWIILVNPGIHVNTGWAFGQLAIGRGDGAESPAFAEGGKPTTNAIGLPTPEASHIASWRDTLVNDFEAPVFAAYPEVARIKETLYATGAVYASMTGSGSTVYGLFPKKQGLPRLSFPTHYWTATI